MRTNNTTPKWLWGIPNRTKHKETQQKAQIFGCFCGLTQACTTQLGRALGENGNLFISLSENDKCLHEHCCALCALHVLAVALQACSAGHAGSAGFPVDTLVVVSAEYISAD